MKQCRIKQEFFIDIIVIKIFNLRQKSQNQNLYISYRLQQLPKSEKFRRERASKQISSGIQQAFKVSVSLNIILKKEKQQTGHLNKMFTIGLIDLSNSILNSHFLFFIQRKNYLIDILFDRYNEQKLCKSDKIRYFTSQNIISIKVIAMQASGISQIQNDRAANNQWQEKIKKLLELIGKTPKNINNSIIFLYPNQDSQPTLLFNQFKQNDQQYFDNDQLFYCQTQFKGVNTMIYGLDITFINLVSSNQKQLNYQHLILLYLLNKFQNVKFCICFDYQIIEAKDLRDLKNFFSLLNQLINYQQINNNKYKESFMIIYNNQNQQHDNLIKYGAKRLKSQIVNNNDKKNYNYVAEIIDFILSKQRCIQVTDEQNISENLKQFKRKISQVSSLNLKINGISAHFMKQMKEKSKNWVFLQGSNNGIQKEQNRGIKYLFYIWSNFFNQFIQLFTNPDSQPIEFFLQRIQRLQRERDLQKQKQYKKQLSKSNKNINPDIKTKLEGFQCTNLLSGLLTLLKKIANQKISLNNNEKLLIKTQLQYLIQFIEIFFQNKILDQQNQKSIKQHFDLFSQLAIVFYQIPDEQNIGSPFFDSNDLMKNFLSDNKNVQKLIKGITKILTKNLQSYRLNAQKSDSTKLHLLQNPIKNIKSELKLQIFQQYNSKLFIKEIDNFRQTLIKFKIASLSEKPAQKLKYLHDLFNNKETNQIFTTKNDKELLRDLAYTISLFIREYHIKTQISIWIKIIDLLETTNTKLEQISQISQIYERQFEILMQKMKKQKKNPDKQELKFITSSINHLLKLGFIQEANKKKHFISKMGLGQKVTKELQKSRLKNDQQQVSPSKINKNTNEDALQELIKNVFLIVKKLLDGKKECMIKLENEMLDI